MDQEGVGGGGDVICFSRAKLPPSVSMCNFGGVQRSSPIAKTQRQSMWSRCCTNECQSNRGIRITGQRVKGLRGPTSLFGGDSYRGDSSSQRLFRTSKASKLPEYLRSGVF